MALTDAAARLRGCAGGDRGRRRPEPGSHDAAVGRVVSRERSALDRRPRRAASSRRTVLAHGGAGTATAERGEGLDHGAVVIAAITSCTNTSNPSVMLGAGLLAKKAVEAGLTRKPWVKTSPRARLEGRDRVPRARRPDRAASSSSASTWSATAAPPASATRARCPRRSRRRSQERDLVVCSVLSGNRNFEGRIHPEVKMNYLASPPLCVAYALAGRMDVDLARPSRSRATSTCATSGLAGARSTR